MDKQKQCIAVDFDGTLAIYETGDIDKFGNDHLGKPIPEMVKKVKQFLAAGIPVVIFTARVNPSEAGAEDAAKATEAYLLIADWCKKVFGKVLPITHEKSRHFSQMIDDKGVGVVQNTGVYVTELMESLK